MAPLSPAGLRACIRSQPRLVAAVAFGGATMGTVHASWIASARWGGAAPALTLAAGLAHAIAGAVTGARLMDGTRTRAPEQALGLGAATSLLAIALFTPPFALWVLAPGGPAGTFSLVVFTVFVGLFSFLGAGWALVLVSAGVGWLLWRLSGSGRAPSSSSAVGR